MTTGTFFKAIVKIWMLLELKSLMYVSVKLNLAGAKIADVVSNFYYLC